MLGVEASYKKGVDIIIIMGMKMSHDVISSHYKGHIPTNKDMVGVGDTGNHEVNSNAPTL